MRQAIGNYLEQQIHAADAVQLICLYYRQCIKAVREAREAIASGNIAAKGKRISLAHRILAELYRSLDFQTGDGALARELGRLYSYMMRKLIEANARQAEDELCEIQGLLSSLLESWEEVSRGSIFTSTAPAAESQAAPDRWRVPEDAGEHREYSYSF